MDAFWNYCVKHLPQVALYQAIHQMVEGLSFPIETRDDLFDQLAHQGEDARATLLEKLGAMPVYYYPLSSKGNALDKLTAFIEGYLAAATMESKNKAGEQPLPVALSSRLSDPALDPGSFSNEPVTGYKGTGYCRAKHLMALDAISGSGIQGWGRVDATMDAIDWFNRCMAATEEHERRNAAEL